MRTAYSVETVRAAERELMARLPEAKVHLYGKGERPDRKIGHINIVGRPGQDPADVRERAERAAHWMSTAVWTDGWDPHAADA